MESKNDNSGQELREAILQLLDDKLKVNDTPLRDEGLRTDIRQALGGNCVVSSDNRLTIIVILLISPSIS